MKDSKNAIILIFLIFAICGAINVISAAIDIESHDKAAIEMVTLADGTLCAIVDRKAVGCMESAQQDTSPFRTSEPAIIK